MGDCFERIRFPIMKSRIVFINFWPKGGMRHYSDALVNVLSKEYEVYYFTNYESSVQCNKQIFKITLSPFDGKNYSELILLCRYIVKLKPQVIHINSGHPTLLSIYFFFSFYNSFVTVHDAVTHEGERSVKKVFHKIQLFLFSCFFKKILVHSEKIKNQLPFFVNRKKVYVVPHVRLDQMLCGAETKKEVSREKFSVLFFGRILKYKGLEYLVEAFKGLDEKKFELIIAGEGVIDFEIKNQNIKIINRFIEDGEMGVLFGNANIVVLPYVSASQSGVVKLAFAFGKPVIVTDVGAISEIVFNEVNGLVVSPTSSEELRDAIKRISEPSTYFTLVKNIEVSNKQEDIDEINKILSVYNP